VGRRRRQRDAFASLQVFANGSGSRVVWIADFLPNDIAGTIDGLMNAGSAAMKAALEG
jgi:hypothetical protein